MRKNDRVEQGLTATGAVHRAKVFGIKSMTVVMTATMLLSGVPTAAIAEELQEAGIIATQDSTDQGSSSEQQTTDQSDTQDQSQTTSDQGDQSGSQDNAAETQNSSQTAQSTQQAATADIALTLNNASITYKGQVIAQPSQKVTASTSDNFQFNVQPDNGYKLNRVQLTVNGSDRELKADANGAYTVDAADVAQGSMVTLETEQEKNGETAEQATPIEDSGAVAVQSADVSAPQATVEMGDTFELSASKGDSWWEWYADGPFTVSDNHKKTITVKANEPGWTFDGDYKDYTFTYRYGVGQYGSEYGTETVRLYKRTFNVSAAPSFEADGDHYWVPVLTDSKNGEEISVTNGKIEIQYWKNGEKIANQYDRDAPDKRQKFYGAGSYEVRIVVNEGWIYRAGTTVIDPSKSDDGKTIDADSPKDHIYDGKEHKWTPAVTDADGKTVPESGYTVIYKRDGKETTDFTSTGTITVTITGKGKYSGTIERSYCIYGIEGKDKIKVGDKTTYTGSGFTSDVTWSSSDSGILTIDPNTGEATGVYPGTVTIYAVDKDGHSCSKEVTVVEDSSKGAWVYLYTKVVYNGKSLSDGGVEAEAKKKELGLTVNKDGWFTLGKLWVSDIEAASGSNGGRSNGSDGSKKIAGFRNKAIALLPRTIRYKTANGGINLSDVNWGYMTNVGSGAADYVSAGHTWHLDGNIDIKSMSKVTVHYVELGNKSHKLADSVEVAAQTGSTFVPGNEVISINGYNFAQADPAITVDETGKQEVYLYYSKGNYPYTVKYVDKETGNDLADSSTVRGEYGAKVTVDALKFQGYSVDKAEKSLTIGSGDNTIIFYYTKKSVKYTIEYVWDGHEIAERSTGLLKFGESVTADAKTVDGYTIIPNPTLTKTAGDNDFTITVKYYKNVTLTAKSNTDSYKYNGETQELTGYTSSAKDAKFEGIEAKGSGKDAGNYDVVFADGALGRVSEDEKYIVSATKNGTLKINKRNVTLTSATDSKKYDGKALSNSNITVSNDGFVSGEGASYSVTGSQTLPGGSDNEFSYTLNENTKADNYVIETKTGKLTVTALDKDDEKMEITVRSRSVETEYDAHDHEASGLESDTFTIDGVTYHVSGLTATSGLRRNAGTYENEISGTPLVTDESGNDVTQQFKIKKDQGKLTIKKKVAYITSASATKAYDGKPLEKHEVIRVEGFFGTDAPTLKFTGSQTEVGHSKNAFTYTETDNVKKNYDVKVEYGTLEVTKNASKVVVNIEMNSDSVTYDGKEHSVSGYAVKSISGAEGYTADDIQFNGAAVSRTDAGTYANMGEGKFSNKNDAYSDVEFHVVDGVLTISKRRVTLKSASDSKEYDGTSLTKDEVTIDESKGDGGFAGTQGFKATVTGAQTDAGTSKNTFSYELADGAKPDNYEISTVEGDLTVTPVTDEIVVTVDGAKQVITYDGKKHTIEGVTLTSNSDKFKEGRDFRYVGTKSVSGIDAKAYIARFSGTDFEVLNKENFPNAKFNYKDESGKSKGLTLVIEPKDVQVTTPNASKVYDGTALTAEGKIEGLANGETVDFKTTGSQTKVGSSQNSYSIDWTGAKKNNYRIAEESLGTLTVTKQSINPENTNSYKGITVGNLKDVKYNGKDQKQEPVVKNGSAGLVKGRDYELSYSRDTVNAGEVTVTVKGIGNYTGEVTRTYNITPRHVKLSSNTHSKTYDGTALTDATVVETGEDSFVTGEVSNIRATGSITIPGTVDNSITFDKGEKFKESNYVIEYQTGKLTVDHKDVASRDMTVGKPNDTIYNGHEQKFEPVVKDGEKELTKGVDYDLSYSDDVTNAGTVTVTVTGKGNYTGTTTVEYKINKRPVTLVSNGYTKNYDGTVLEDHDVAVTSQYDFVAGEVADLTANGSITEPGEVTNKITYTKKDGYKDSNYDVTITEGTLKVLPRDMNATGMEISELEDVVYNGLDQKQAPEVKDSKTGATLVAGTDYDVTFSEDTKSVGVVAVTITGKGNYTGTATRIYKITPAPLTVKTDGAAREYNGRALTAGGTITGLVNGESVDFKTTGSQTKVGSSQNSYSIDWTGAKKNNYKIVEESLGTLTVTESSQTIVVVTTGGRYEYDGLTHTPTVNVYNLPEGYTVHDASSNAAVKDVNARKDSDQGVKVTADNLVILNAEGEDVTSKLEIEKADGYLAVTPRTVTVTTPSDSKVYDGTALKAEGAIDGLVDGETAEFKTTGSQTEQGTSDNTYDLKWNGSAKKSNYTVKENIGTLTVSKQSIDKKDEKTYKGIQIDDPASVMYDGAKHQWTPTVTDAEGNTLAAGTDYKVTYKRGDDATDDFKNVGTITVTVEGAGNYTGTVTKTYKITKREVTLTSADGSWTYDGKDHQKADVAVSGDGFAEGEGVDYSDFATVKDVTAQDVENTFKYVAKDGTDLECNYTIKVVAGKLSVTKAAAEGNITLRTKDATKTYDGQALEAGEATAQAATDDDVRIEYSLDHETWTENRSEVALTDAGNQTVYVRASSKKSYSGYVEGTENLTVNPATVTIVTNSGEKVYDGKTLTADGSMKGLVNGETATFKVTGSLAAVGEIDNAYTLTWDGTAKRDNYTIEDAVGKLKVTPRSIDDTDYGMTVSSPEDVTYDGTEHKWAPVVKDGNKTLVEGTDYTVAYDKDDFTNVTGTIKMTITGKGNYTGSVDRFYQITPAQLTVETEGTSKVYDGEALTHDVATIKGLKNGESATIHATGTQTEVGESDNNYQITWDGSAKQGNYTVARETLGKLVVSESADQITATPVNVTAQYDGEAHGTTVEVTGLPKGYTVKEVKSKATATNVSDGEVTAKVDELVIINAQGKDVTSKLNIKRGAATIKITPAPLTVSTDGGKKEYDGTALTAKGIKVDGLKGGDKVSARATGSRTKVGTSDNTYSIDWTGAKASNYTVTDELGTLEVTPSTAAVTLMSGSDTRVYNGRALSSDKITAEGLPAGFTVEATMDGSQTDAGSSKNTVKSYRILDAKGDDVTGMFTNVTVKPGTLKVTPKQITVETEGATKVYDGTALTNGNGTISGLISGERADVVTNGAQIEVGSSKNGYTIAWGTAKEGNYTVASDKLGDLVVTSQSVNPDDPTYRNLTVNDPEDVTYDGNAHKWAPEVKDASGNTLKEGVDYALSYSTDDFVDAGAITVTITGKGNYSGTVSKTYRIKPASVSIKTDSASRAYNGRALTAGGAITGLVNGETVDFKTTGARTKVGTSDNTYALNWTGSAKASNYSIDSIEIGKLTITESADEIVVTTTGGTFTYDGKAHGASVAVSQLPEGYTLETAAATATVTDVTDEAVKATADQLVIRNAEGEDVTSRLNIKKVDGTITVNPAELTVATDSASKVYDGIALTAGGTVTGLVNGEEATLDMTGKQAEVGSSENTYKLTFDKSAKAKNYKVVSENIGTLTVTAQSITPGTEEEPSDSYKGITVSDPEDSVYDGTEHQWSPVVEDAEGNELEEGADYEVAYDTDDFVDVATITVTITGKGNYAGTVTKSYRITKAPLHIATGSATKVYDGAALTDATVTVDGLAQTDRIGITVTGQQTAVGNSKNSYTIDWMQVNQDNYELTDELGTLTVTPAPVTPQNPATPGVTPTTSGAPGGTPAASTGNNVVNTIATALASGYSAVTGDNDATAPSEEQIFDAQNPLGKFEGKKDTCWVHWYMILCGIVTAVYGVLVGLRRRKHSRRLQKDLDKVLGNDDEAQE